MGREEGGGFRMGNMCMPVADSFLYMAEPINIVKFKNKILKIKIKKKQKKKKSILISGLENNGSYLTLNFSYHHYPTKNSKSETNLILPLCSPLLDKENTHT